VFGAVSGHAGETVTLEVSLRAGLDPVAGTFNEIELDASFQVAPNKAGRPACRRNPAIDKNATLFAFSPAGCTPRFDCTSVRAVVLSLENVAPIPDGSLLYTCQLEIDVDAVPGTHTLRNVHPQAGGSYGNEIPVTGSDGTITVLRREHTKSIRDGAGSTETGPSANDLSGCQIDAAPSPSFAPALLLLLAALLRAWRRSAP
jgi:hypothetical protein